MPFKFYRVLQASWIFDFSKRHAILFAIRNLPALKMLHGNWRASDQLWCDLWHMHKFGLRRFELRVWVYLVWCLSFPWCVCVTTAQTSTCAHMSIIKSKVLDTYWKWKSQIGMARQVISTARSWNRLQINVIFDVLETFYQLSDLSDLSRFIRLYPNLSENSKYLSYPLLTTSGIIFHALSWT